MSIEFSQRVFIPPDILMRNLDGKSVLLNLSNEAYYGLDEVGTEFWQELQKADTIQQAYDALLEVFDVDEQRLHGDMQTLLGELLEQGLIELADSDTAKR